MNRLGRNPWYWEGSEKYGNGGLRSRCSLLAQPTFAADTGVRSARGYYINTEVGER